MSETKKSKLGIGIALFVIITITGVMFGLYRCSESATANIVNLAVKEDGKTHLYSIMGTFIVNNSIEKNESPSVMPFLRLYDDGGLFVAPSQVKEISELILGNNIIHDYKEMSYDGYITSNGDSEVYTLKVKNQSTKKIGEQVAVNTITLTNPTNSKTMEIVWEKGTKDRVGTPIENCSIQSFYVKENPHAGETVISSQDFLVVDLNKITKFFDNGSSLEFNKDEQILYVIKK